jgi:hypothetical protein
MAVIGTPVAGATGLLLGPVTTTLYDIPVPPKRRALAMTASTCASLRVQILDDNGDPVDLSVYSPDNFTVTLAVGEYIGSDPALAKVSVGVMEPDCSSGWVSAALPSSAIRQAGIYLAQISLTDDTLYPRCGSDGETITAITPSATELVIDTLRLDDTTYSYVYPFDARAAVGVGEVLVLRQQIVKDVCLALSNTLYLGVEKGILGAETSTQPGPPSLAEVRLELRDFPEVNRLLDEYEFDAAEVHYAAMKCVDYFNEVPPSLDQVYDGSSFPSRFHWMEGTIYYLLRIAVAWYDRNKLEYNAGGVAINDLNRSEAYLRHMQMRQQKWEDWVRRTKLKLNSESGFLSLGSEYSNGWW